MQELEFRGEWWLPNEENRVAGILEFHPDDGGTLELIGSFDDWGPGQFRRVDLINGRTTNGKQVTLEDCWLQPSSISSGVKHQTCGAKKIFTGVSFYGDDLYLDKVCFSLPLLELWTSKNIVHVPEGKMTGATISDFDVIEAELDNATVRVNLTPSQSNRMYDGIEITQQAFFCIEPDKPQKLDDYLNDYIRHLQHFICLALGEPVNPNLVKGYFEHEGRTEKTDIVYQVSHLPEVPEKKHPGRLLFNLDDIDFEKALQKWFESAQNAEMAHNLYFGTQYNETMFQENKFLSLVIALESYQSYLFPDHRLMEKAEYDQLHTEILNTIPDDAAAKGRIDNLLGSIGNQGSLHDQLSLVLYEYEEILDELIEIEAVIRNSKNERHNIAHGLGKEYDLNEIGDTAQKLQVVIEAIFLDTIGLETDFIKRKLEKNRKHLLT